MARFWAAMALAATSRITIGANVLHLQRAAAEDRRHRPRRRRATSPATARTAPGASSAWRWTRSAGPCGPARHRRLRDRFAEAALAGKAERPGAERHRRLLRRAPGCAGVV